MCRARLFVLALATAACASSGWPDLIDPRELGPSFGAPALDRVRDLGNPELPALGPLLGAEPDGVATPGEILLVEGSGFGRQPTVMVGGRPTQILGRTSGGGLVLRVPTGVAPGAMRIEVATPRGRAGVSFPLRRFGLVTVGEQSHVHVLEIGHEGAHPFGHPLELRDAELVRFAHDGSTAYVIARAPGGTTRLHVVDVTAPHGPRVVGTQEVPLGRVLAGASADGAPLLALVGEREVVLFDLTATRRPARWPPLSLPDDLGHADILGAALDPDGKTLALLTARRNQVRIFDVSTGRALKPVTTVDVLPSERSPLVRDLQFSVDGEILWVVSGDNAASLGAGSQPTRLSAIRLLPPTDHAGPRVVSMWRTMAVPGAAAPIGLAVSRGQPVASGATIRVPPEKAAVFITGISRNLFSLAGVALESATGLKKASALLSPTDPPGMMMRADMSGGGGPVFTTPQILSSVDLTPDAQVLVATACRAAPGPGGELDFSFGVVWAPLWGRMQPQFVPLEKVSAALLRPPFRFGQVRIQP